MTLRIFVENDEDAVTVALHGRLGAAEVAEVERVTSEQDRPLRIDLAHLTGVDTEGVWALRRLRQRGASVTEASPFIEMMLDRTAQDTSAPEEADGPLVR